MTGAHRDRDGRRSYRALLSCGTVLEFESSTFVPAPGEQVPCARHGYCAVTTRSRELSPREPRPGRMSRRRRTTDDLLRFLSENPGASSEKLRRSGFSLRLIGEARPADR